MNYVRRVEQSSVLLQEHARHLLHGSSEMMSDTISSIVHGPSALRGPRSSAFKRGHVTITEPWQVNDCRIQDRTTLSLQEKSQLESAAFTFGQAPETYDVACTQGTMFCTPCGNGILNLHKDGRFWHIPGGIIAPLESQAADRQLAEGYFREEASNGLGLFGV